MVLSLTAIRLWLARYGMSLTLSFGLLGNMLNILMFVRKERIQNSCMWYLLTGFIINIVIISWGVVPSLYTLDYPNPATYSFLYCKLRHYMLHTVLMLGRSMTVLACFDRFALCTNLRQFHFINNVRVAKRLIISVLIMWPLLNIHLPINYHFTGNACTMVQSYRFFWAIYSVVVPGLLMPILMGVFGILAVLHRRKLQTRLNEERKGVRKRDYTLMMMLFAEVSVYIISTSPFPAFTLYQALSEGQMKTIDRQQIEAFVGFLATSFLIYINPSAGFYIYILASRSYRMELKCAFVRLSMRCTGRTTQVVPGTMMNEVTIQQRTAYF